MEIAFKNKKLETKEREEENINSSTQKEDKSNDRLVINGGSIYREPKNCPLGGGKNVIYNIPVDSLPWLTAQVEDMMYKMFLSPYIYYLDGVTVKTSDKEYAYKITGDDEEHTFTGLRYPPMR